MTNPEIVTGVSMALLFAFLGMMLRINSILGFWTLLIAHITFNLPYIILNVMPKLTQMDPDLTEAALDLGCTPTQAFFKVTLHEILPGIVSGALMAFTMSLDDFVISYFVTGSGFVTLPVEINASARALKWLDHSGLTSSAYQKDAEDALRAAAYTYVVAALSSLVTLLYYLSIFLGGRRRD